MQLLYLVVLNCYRNMNWIYSFLLILPLVVGHYELGLNLAQKPFRDDNRLNYRLPLTLSPYHYVLNIEPELNKNMFFGSVLINTTAYYSDVTNITLHILNLEPYEIAVFSEGKRLELSGVEYDLERDFLILHLTEILVRGSAAEIKIDYIGEIKNDKRGFYKAKYLDENNEEKLLALTHFEPTDARLAFPCFDEPSFKATFELVITRYNYQISTANAKLRESISIGPNKMIDYYHFTPRMSTNILAFVVAEYKKVSKTDLSGIEHSIYGTAFTIDDGRALYSLDWSILVLQLMSDFTDIRYGHTMSKIDQIAVPDVYLWFESIENWGCVIYRESMLMYKEGELTTKDKQRVISAIAHGYAHQWFGNLVTPTWWKYIWLNEGFATYFEHFITSIIEPGFRIMDQFVIKSYHVALDIDSREYTIPITVDVEWPEDIRSIFNIITFEKGGSLVRMLEHFLMHDIFKEGLRIHLKRNEFQVVDERELFANLQEAYKYGGGTELGSLTIEEIMETWKVQKGFPVVKITRDYATNTAEFTQTRFYMDGSIPIPNTTWHIPINYARAGYLNFGETTPEFWLSGNEIRPISAQNNEWILANKQQTGFYRVNYDETNWTLLISHLKSANFEDIHPINRAQLLNDALHLAIAGHVQWQVVIDIMVYIAQETDYIPLYAFFVNVRYLDSQLIEQDIYPDFKRFVIDLLKTAYLHLGAIPKPNDKPVDILNRDQVLYWLCYYESEDCYSVLKSQLEAKTNILPDSQISVYCNGMRSDNAEDVFNWLLERLESQKIEDLEKERIVKGLTCGGNEKHLKMIVDIILSIDTSRKLGVKDRTGVLKELFLNSKNGKTICMDLIVQRYQELQNVFHVKELDDFIYFISKHTFDKDYLTKLGASDVNQSQVFYFAQINIDNNAKSFSRHICDLIDAFSNFLR